MSKMGSHFLNTADDRADRDADEVAWLRAEVERLEAEKAVLYVACVKAANLFEVLDGVLSRHGEALRGAREAMAAVFDPAA